MASLRSNPAGREDDSLLEVISADELCWFQFLDRVLVSTVRQLEYLWAMTWEAARRALPGLEAAQDRLTEFYRGAHWRRTSADMHRHQVAYYVHLIVPSLLRNLEHSVHAVRESGDEQEYRRLIGGKILACCERFFFKVCAGRCSNDRRGASWSYEGHTHQQLVDAYNRLFFSRPIFDAEPLEEALNSLEDYLGQCYGTHTVVPPWLIEASEACALCHRNALVSGGNGIFEAFSSADGRQCEHLVRLLDNADDDDFGNDGIDEGGEEEQALFRLQYALNLGGGASDNGMDELDGDASEYAYWAQEGRCGGEDNGRPYKTLEALWRKANAYLIERGLCGRGSLDQAAAGFQAYVGVPGVSKPRFLSLLESNIKREIRDHYRLSDPDVYGHLIRQLEQRQQPQQQNEEEGTGDIPLLRQVRTDPFSVTLEQIRRVQRLQNDASKNRSKLTDVDNLKTIIAESKATYANCYLTPLLGSGMAELGFAFRRALYAERVFLRTARSVNDQRIGSTEMRAVDLDYAKGKQFTATAVRQFGLDEQLFRLLTPSHFNAYNFKQSRLRHGAAFALAAHSLGIKPHQISMVESFAAFEGFARLKFSEQILAKVDSAASADGGLLALPHTTHGLFEYASQLVVLLYLHNISSTNKIESLGRADDADQLLEIRGGEGDEVQYNLQPGLYVTWRPEAPYVLVMNGGRVLCDRNPFNLLHEAFSYSTTT